MRGRGAGVLLIVVIGVGMAAGQGMILPPIPDGPPLTIRLAGDTEPAGAPKAPPLPPVPGAVTPPAPSVVPPPTTLPPASKVPGPNPLSDIPPVTAPAGETHPLFETPWHPEPPPATYSTSGCNFNVWCGNELFSPDFSTVQILAGGYFTSKSIGPKIPRFDYIPISIRSGMMLNAPQDTDAWWRGNMEILGDLTAGKVTSSYGKYLFGPAVIGRYNFVQPNASLIPYIQAGAGFVLTDANKDESQNAIGQSFNARLFAGVGVHCLLQDNLFLDVEGGYSSISNLGLGNRGVGAHSLGVQIGLTYFFRSGGR